MLEVLQCVLLESPEALNAIKENHIRAVISFLDKQGFNHKVAFRSFGTQMKHLSYCVKKSLNIDECYNYLHIIFEFSV